MSTPISDLAAMSFPQVAGGLTGGERGICSLRWGADVLRFRTNPNEFNWQYTLNKRIETTYGGRVVQLLGTRIDEFTLKADAGGGRWDYMNKVATFCRDVMINQRNGTPATLDYTTRGWRLNVYVVSVPFQDAVEEVLREFDIQFKVQQDVSGVMSRTTLGAELRRLKDGIGFQRSQYNDPRLQGGKTAMDDQESSPVTQTIDQIVSGLGGVLGYVNNPFLPGMATPGSSPGGPGTTGTGPGTSLLPGIGVPSG